MSYLTQARLQNHPDFTDRCRSALLEQASVFVNDARPQFIALSNAILLDQPAQVSTFIRGLAAAPGFADEADNGDGTVDPSKIADAEILSAVQNQWPGVASLFYQDDGTPVPPNT
jgi:hypothetical protein